MKISLNQKQMDFLKSKAINTGFCAGLGSGKSYVATLKTILKKINHPNLTVAYYLPTYGLIRDIAFDKFPTMLSEMGYKYKLNKSDKEIHIEDYGKIIFRGMDNPETIVGYEVFYSIIDECDILPMDKMTTAYNKIMARNRQKCPDGTINQIDVASTPEGFKWFYKRYVKDFNEETDLLVRASTYENKHLPPQYILNLEQEYPPALLKAYLMGEFVNLTSGVVYNHFDRHNHDTKAVINPHEILYIGQDFNVGGCCGAVIVIRNGLPYMLEEYSCYDTHAVVNYLKEHFKGHEIWITPDSSGNNNNTNSSKTDIAILRDAGFKIDVPSKNPFIQDRVNTLNTLCYKNEFRINTAKCPNTTQGMEQQAYDATGKPEKYSGADTIDDRTDAIGYIIYRRFGIDRPKLSNYTSNML